MRFRSIVATSRVRVLACAVAHGNIYLTVAKSEDISQPNALSQTGTTQRVPADVAMVTEGGGGLHVFPELPTVQEVSAALNSLGATPHEELYILYRYLAKRFEDLGVTVVMPLVGRYATSMEMTGASLTICKLDRELEELLHAPANCAVWRVG